MTSFMDVISEIKDLTNFKIYCDEIEEKLSNAEVTSRIYEIISNFDSLPTDYKEFFQYTFLPKVTKKILSLCIIDTSPVSIVIQILKKVVEICINEIQLASTPYMDLFVALLDPNSKFYYYSSLNYSEDQSNMEDDYCDKAKNNNSDLTTYFVVINHLGQIHGFASILNQIKKEDCPLTVMLCYFQALQFIAPYLKTTKLIPITETIVNEVLPQLKSIDSERILLSNPIDIKDFVKSLTSIILQCQDSKFTVQHSESSGLDIALHYLNTDSIAHKVKAVSFIYSIIRGIKKKSNSFPLWIAKTFILFWILENKVIKLMFEEPKNIQIIDYAQDIVKFVSKKNFLDVDSLEIIWNNALKSHSTISKKTFVLLSNISDTISDDDSHYILSKLKMLTPKQYTENILFFINEMCNKADNYLSHYLLLLLDILTEDVDESIVLLAFEYFTSLISKSFFHIYRRSILMKSISYIREKDFSRKSLFFTIISSILSSYNENRNGPTLDDIIDDLEDSFTFHKILINELDSFKTYCKEKIENIIPSDEDVNSYLSSFPFPGTYFYLSEIKCRLNLLFLVLIDGNININQQFVLNRLWNNLYIDALSEEEKNECINWFYSLQFRPQYTNSSFTSEYIPFIFEEFIMKINPFTVTFESFYCFEKYFYSANSHALTFNNEGDKNSFIVDVYPSDLLGEKELWQIVLVCLNDEVSKYAMSLLISIYDRVSPKVVDSDVVKFQFLLQCLSNISTSTDILRNDLEVDEDIERLYVLRSLQLISLLVDKIQQLLPKANIHSYDLTLKVIARYTLENKLNELNFDTKVKSSTKSFELRNHIKEKVSSIFEGLGIKIENLEFSNPLKDNKYIQDIGINDFDEIIVENKPLYNGRKTLLKFKNGTYDEGIPEAEDIVVSCDSQNSDIIDIFSRRFNEKLDDIGYPQWILSVQDNIEVLFNAMTLEDGEITSLCWDILSTLPIPNNIKDQYAESTVKTNWEITLLPNHIHKTLYNLNIINQILSCKLEDKVTDWIIAFIKSLGHESILNTLSHILESHEVSNILNDPIKKDIFLISFQIMDYLLTNNFINVNDLNVEILKKTTTIVLENHSIIKQSDLILYSWRIFKHIIVLSSLESVVKDFRNLIKDIFFNNEDKNIRTITSRELYRIMLSHSGMTDDLLTTLLLIRPNKESDVSIRNRAESYYWLLNKLFEFKAEDKLTDEFQKTIEQLRDDLFDLILNSDLYEEKLNNITDWVLCGSLLILSNILKFDKSYQGSPELVSKIFYELLFDIKCESNITYPKCKTSETRRACFILLIQLSKLNERNFTQLANLLTVYHYKYGHELDSWDFNLEDECRKLYSGIKNCGASCYMSSMMQQFFMMPKLRNDIFQLNIDYSEETKMLIQQLQILFGYLQESERAEINPYNFFKAYYGKEVNELGEQQDANEFFNLFCHKIEDQLKGTENEKLFHKHFVGKLSNLISSEDPNYPYISEQEEEFYSLPIDITSRNNLESSLELFIEKHMLVGENQYYCDKFETKINASKKSTLKELPNTLIFQLMRFDYNLQTGSRKKLNNYFSFPNSIDMKSYIKESSSAQESYIYNLVGIIVHMGDAENGHYYSIIKERNNGGRWLLFNDRSVTEFDPEKISEDCFGGVYVTKIWDEWHKNYIRKEVSNDKNAYMLFYDRAQDETDESSKHIVYTLPEFVRSIVWEDNSRFLRDLFLFNSSYIEFLLNLMKSQFITNSPKIETYDHIIRFIMKFTLESVVYLHDTHLIHRWFSCLRSIYSSSPKLCNNFVEYVEDKKIIYKVLLSCPNENIRIEFSDFLVVVLKTLIVHGNKNAENDLILHIYNLLEDSRVHWKRFKQYFHVMKEYALMGVEQRQTLLELNIIEDFVDYFTGKEKGFQKRASVMDKTHFPDMVEFHDIFSIIIRGCNINKNLGSAPNKLEGELLDISEKTLEPLWSVSFFNSFMHMDYNTDAIVEIITYLGYNSIERSDFILRILADQFEGNPSKRHITERLFEAMILIEDGEEFISYRIKNYISSFKHQFRIIKSSPLLRTAKAKSNPLPIIYFVLSLSHKSKHLYQFLSSSRDLYWIIDACESALEEEFKSFMVEVDKIEQDLEKGYHLLLFKDDLPAELMNYEIWRRSKSYFAFLYSLNMAKQNVDSYNEYLLMHQLRNKEYLITEITETKNSICDMEKKSEVLKHHISLLIKVMKKLKLNAKNKLPENIEDLLNKVDESLEMEDTDINLMDDDILDNYIKECDDGPSENDELDNLEAQYSKNDDFEYEEIVNDVKLPKVSKLSDDIYLPMGATSLGVEMTERLQQLKDFFPDLDDSILLEALRSNNFDVELAASDLMG